MCPGLINTIPISKPIIADYFLTTLGKLFGNKEMRILMLGLDAAGKTSTLYLHILLGIIGS